MPAMRLGLTDPPRRLRCVPELWLFEVFLSVSDPDKLVLLELWKDQAALDAHAKLQARRPALPEGLWLGAGEREDYTYNRTR